MSDTGDSDVCSVRSFSTVPTPSDWMDMMEETDRPTIFITDVPEEILEIILCELSPYRDFKSAMLVCKQWYRVIRGLIGKLHKNFHQAVMDSKIKWATVNVDTGPSITERYSHCACYYNKSLYVFGGCTSTNTTFNDLWRFDLATRLWIRPLAMGTYPAPKACASMVVHRDRLVLYGGWSHPSPYPLHQAARFFSELHIYDPLTNRWTHVPCISRSSPPPVAGHSASIIGDEMVVFGGSHLPNVGNNEVWVFNLIDATWRKQATSQHTHPKARYGQTQVTLDDKHILIVGGCGGANQVFNDTWMLTVETDTWRWSEIHVTNTEYATPLLWCHPACKVGNNIVLLSKVAKTSQTSSPKLLMPAGRPFQPADDVQEQRHVNPSSHPHTRPPPPRQPGGMPSGLQQANPRDSVNQLGGQGQSPFRPPPTPLSVAGGQGLQPLPGPVQQAPSTSSGSGSGQGASASSAFRSPNASLSSSGQGVRAGVQASGVHYSTPGSLDQGRLKLGSFREARSPMQLHVLDVSEAVSHCQATWRPLREIAIPADSPEETVFYSLSEGRGELIMFGGIQKDISMEKGIGSRDHHVSKNLYIISAMNSPL